MLYRTHATTSLAISIPILYGINHLSVLGAGAMVLGTVLPDIDEEDSFIGSKCKPISFAINKIFGHRGITHSLLMVIILVALSTYTKYYLIGCLALGYFLHLFEDYFSKAGIKWLQPFSGHDFRVASILRYEVGGFKEKILFVFWSVVLLLDLNRVFNFHIYIPILTDVFNAYWWIVEILGKFIYTLI